MSFQGFSIPSPADARPSSPPLSTIDPGESTRRSDFYHGGHLPRAPIRILSEAHITSTHIRINALDDQTTGLFNEYLHIGRMFHSLPEIIRRPRLEVPASACHAAFKFDPARPEQTSTTLTALKDLQICVAKARKSLADAEENDLRVIGGLTM